MRHTVGCNHHGVDAVAPNAACTPIIPNKDTKNNFFMSFSLACYFIRFLFLSQAHTFGVCYSVVPVDVLVVVSVVVLGVQYPQFVLALVSV